MKSTYSRVYDFSIPPGGTIYLEVPGDYYKIISSTGNIGTKRDASNILQPMYAGRGEKGAEFQRLALRDLSGSTNTGQILIANGAEMVDSSLQLLGAITQRPESSSGNFKSAAVLAALAVEKIIDPTVNSNGLILLSAGWAANQNATLPTGVMLANTTAPASVTDGEVILYASAGSLSGTGFEWAELKKAELLTAGLGLWFISTNGCAGYGARYARWKAL
jgi:hypothetical protein